MRVIAIATMTVPKPAPSAIAIAIARIRSGKGLQKLDDALTDNVEASAEIAAGQTPERAERGAEQHAPMATVNEARLP